MSETLLCRRCAYPSMKRSDVLSDVAQEQEPAEEVPVSIEVSYDAYFKCQHDHITGVALTPAGETVRASETPSERFMLLSPQ